LSIPTLDYEDWYKFFQNQRNHWLNQIKDGIFVFILSKTCHCVY
jgi:hypothetical protein